MATLLSAKTTPATLFGNLPQFILLPNLVHAKRVHLAYDQGMINNDRSPPQREILRIIESSRRDQVTLVGIVVVTSLLWIPVTSRRGPNLPGPNLFMQQHLKSTDMPPSRAHNHSSLHYITTQ
jgi:hypothetical protein